MPMVASGSKVRLAAATIAASASASSPPSQRCCTSVRTSIVSGGLLCVVGVGLTAAWLRDFWRYDARTDEHAVREREVRERAAASAA